MDAASEQTQTRPSNFIDDIILEDKRAGNRGGRVHTRFPPEPNGYLHIGHAKSICLNFGTALKYDGLCNLRFDDTNPSKEETEYVDSIQQDVKWLGFDWQDRLFYASDYFQKLYDCAVELIRRGKAFVCDLTADQIREYRGTLTQPGKNSLYRDRTVDENLNLFEQMRQGAFPDGAKTLRARIDMASPNINMRDPVLYRIQRSTHHRTGDAWCIYPMYDYAHPLSDAFEGITHSICTLEFEDHRPLYDWCLKELGFRDPPRQIEFARLNLNYTVMSKRKLLELVKNRYVSGWDDPRLPTISGLRRRGYTPASIRSFADRIGVAKSNSTVDIGMLEFCVREDLNKTARRVMAVLRPVKLVIENYPEGKTETLEAENNPEDPSAGTRTITFSRELYIDREDFRETAPPKYFRLYPGNEVRLKHAYFVKCTGFEKNPDGSIREIRCTYDPATKSGESQDGRKVKGTLHWVNARDAVPVEVRLYERLFSVENPDAAGEGGDYRANLNPDSLVVLKNAMAEASLARAKPGETFQFLRSGYFCVDPDSKPGVPVFNRTVTLNDSWAKIEKKLK